MTYEYKIVADISYRYELASKGYTKHFYDINVNCNLYFFLEGGG